MVRGLKDIGKQSTNELLKNMKKYRIDNKISWLVTRQAKKSDVRESDIAVLINIETKNACEDYKAVQKDFSELAVEIAGYFQFGKFK